MKGCPGPATANEAFTNNRVTFEYVGVALVSGAAFLVGVNILALVLLSVLTIY